MVPLLNPRKTHFLVLESSFFLWEGKVDANGKHPKTLMNDKFGSELWRISHGIYDANKESDVH